MGPGVVVSRMKPGDEYQQAERRQGKSSKGIVKTERSVTECDRAELCKRTIKIFSGTSLVVQWLGLHASTSGGTDSIPGWGTKILSAVQCGQKKKKDFFFLPSLVLWPLVANVLNPRGFPHGGPG